MKKHERFCDALENLKDVKGVFTTIFCELEQALDQSWMD